MIYSGKQVLENGTVLHFDIEQGSQEWDDIRLGRITGSGVVELMGDPKNTTYKRGDTVPAGSIIGKTVNVGESNYEKGVILKNPLVADRQVLATPSGKLSQGAETYILKKVSESYLGYTRDKLDLRQFEWGHKYEPMAADYYMVETGQMVAECGFAEHSDWIGCSPDRLVCGTKKGLEIKCPESNAVHLKYLQMSNAADLLKTEKGYYCQIQMCLWVTGFDSWDFVSFDVRMTGKHRFHLVNIPRDIGMIAKIAERCKEAATLIQQKLLEYA